MARLSAKDVIDCHARAKNGRNHWENIWNECYEFALPYRTSAVRPAVPGEKKGDRLFDGTAPDAVDQLAASLMAHLTPPWTKWFGFSVGTDVSSSERAVLGIELDRASEIFHDYLDRSNFAVEIHQCFLDLVTAGTASLSFEEAASGEATAFRFAAVPLANVVVEEGASGRLDTSFLRSELTPQQFAERFSEASRHEAISRVLRERPHQRIPILEAVISERSGYSYLATIEAGSTFATEPTLIAEGFFTHSPFINFRWMKAPGEIYGRSPVMKALPDIKTANKVVELVLKNASIAVTGIWQADDDGVLNPATVKLLPGTIIPKAVGSAGLTPLEAPGRFDVSEIVLDQVRGRIRKALFTDQFGPVSAPKMTATEVLERSAETARILGATYGRLQTELLTPLIIRGWSILARRGEVPDLPIDGRTISLDYKTPLSQYQAQQNVQNTVLWLDAVRNIGGDATTVVDRVAAARWLGRALGVPAEVMREPVAIDSLQSVFDNISEATTPTTVFPDNISTD